MLGFLNGFVRMSSDFYKSFSLCWCVVSYKKIVFPLVHTSRYSVFDIKTPKTKYLTKVALSFLLCGLIFNQSFFTLNSKRIKTIWFLFALTQIIEKNESQKKFLENQIDWFYFISNCFFIPRNWSATRWQLSSFSRGG